MLQIHAEHIDSTYAVAKIALPLFTRSFSNPFH